MFIVSIWNAEEAIAAPNAVAQTFGGEGVGYSIRLQYDWSEGSAYRFRLSRVDGEWWQLSVSEDGGRPIAVGRIRITETVPLQPNFASFSEYLGSVESCEELPPKKATFSSFTYGGSPFAPKNPNAYGNCQSAAAGFLRVRE